MGKTKENAVAVVDRSLPANLGAEFLDTILADAGAGAEDIGAKDQRIPFLGIVQAMSKVRKRNEPEYIPGADEGMIYNNLTQELFDGDEGVRVVVCHFQKEYATYTPGDGDQADKFVAYFGTDQERAQMECKDGDYVQDSAKYFVLYQTAEGDWRPAVIQMRSTQWKAARVWNSHIKAKSVTINGQTIPAPAYLFAYTVKTGYEKKNDHGYYNYSVAPATDADRVDADLYFMAREFRGLVTSDQGRNLKYAEVTETPEDSPEPTY